MIAVKDYQEECSVHSRETISTYVDLVELSIERRQMKASQENPMSSSR
jgi:hypothetical protein